MIVFQKPNKPLLVATIAFLVFAVAPSPIQNGALVVFVISLTIWSREEIKEGENNFRKSLGYGALSALAILLFIILNKI
jgi:hypothetical protein